MTHTRRDHRAHKHHRIQIKLTPGNAGGDPYLSCRCPPRPFCTASTFVLGGVQHRLDDGRPNNIRVSRQCFDAQTEVLLADTIRSPILSFLGFGSSWKARAKRGLPTGLQRRCSLHTDLRPAFRKVTTTRQGASCWRSCDTLCSASSWLRFKSAEGEFHCCCCAGLL